ncbi:phenolphthiocerol/phthiocerol polyketide synthase subunit C-like [Mytilus edulis]|uniref:phenolphthiocerol/phthiocerol polyketide synthase subunit C-like n=1 Tax=Mytilus edulis TaxID=6550 RepID=UPI0039EECD81
MDDENGIAIIGIGCRFPGADDIDEFWKLLENGECHIDIVPEDRWNVQEADIRDPDESWKDCARHAGLINEYDRWDNKFFGVSDTEAACMNPQQCLALEVTHSALENGGLTKGNMKKSKTGVYIGIMNNDLLLGLPNARNEFNNFLVTGIASSITSNRISFHYDLLGPSLTVDTACSSALVSVHLGCQAIRTGECEMAICGGVNSILTPVNFVPLSKAKMISPTGKSHAFSNQADGYVRGEGCGIVILKRYKKAKFDGNHIWGLIATGCNQDGQSNTPITAPSSDQQQALLKEVYSKYQVDPKTVQYIEAHGTGTPVGDPIEIRALSDFFSPCLKNGETIPVGSVKTNIGHLESSAGTAGLIKTLLMMRSEKLVPSLHFKENEGNADINFNEIPLRVVTNISDWNGDSRGQRIACVNSFGFGGTNCHAVVKQMKVETKTSSGNYAFEHYVVCLTGTSIPALQKSVRYLKEKIEQKSYSIKDIAFTSLLKRDHFRYRITYVASSCQDLSADIARKERSFDEMTAVDTKESKLIFLFCGVGTVWKGTCQQMFNSITPFREKFQQIDKEVRKLTKFSIIDEIQNPTDDIISDPYKGPLIIFASQVSLFHLWAHLGVHPDAIIGQSVGEVAASYAAGCLSFEDAVKIIHHRSLLSSKASGGGMMVIGKCEVDEIEKICGQFENKICIAVYSSKEACVVSGDRDVIDKMKERLEKEMPNLLLKKLDVNCAYHSHHMDEISREIEEKLTGIKGKAPNIPLISTVTGENVTDDMMAKPIYWTNNLRKPVLLKEAVSFCMNEEKSNVILEIGPKPVIRAHLSKISSIDAASVASLNQPNEKHIFVNAMADLFQRGFNIQWGNVFDGTEQLIDLPRYKFNRSGILIKSDALREGLRATVKTNNNHPFVFPKPLSRNFRIELSPQVTPYVYEHIVDGRSIAPGAVHGEIGIVVATEILKLPVSQVEISLQFIRPLSVGRDQIIYLETALNEKEKSFEIKRRKDIGKNNMQMIPQLKDRFP